MSDVLLTLPDSCQTSTATSEFAFQMAFYSSLWLSGLLEVDMLSMPERVGDSSTMEVRDPTTGVEESTS